MKQIKLNQSHVHAGVGYSAGDVIDVTDADAVYLIRHQIGTVVKSADENTGKNADKAEQQPPQAEQTENPGSDAETVPSDGETNKSEQGEQ
ncbi:DUF7210 family protein [Aggregatibacter actinomycetemcomitans]|uniref:DUF7210 family protein n=1 Tax=Aggregatibacter actinomycetemcomitans TaxID=714 RepID=UPI00023FFF2B|nr:hypothetical protein [Aggregatibacter actinomycetemcomitans]EHK90589.1 hypothetical protein RHAA1_05283 [Aggregatibacter actinomycetemcomitans RhAA1]KNE77640.1 hypothetical protein RHAA2_05365 [Aggregatibacter actinomycetemcomitans RhAA1]MBN6077250.1 hypothetical protein [Aggregatibacter actinomycetemcomitans]MBN6080076.1 hypothetical protein [Aggregatibacter actinomycetemcomitans]